MLALRLLLLLLVVCCCMPVTRAQDTLTTVQEQVELDLRHEVIEVLHLLSKRRCSSDAEERQKQEVLAQFGKYRNHTAILYWRAIQDKYKIYPYEVSVNLLFQNGRFTVIRQDQNGFLTKMNERERLEFVRLLNDFSYRSDFISYYNNIADNK